MIGDGPQMPPIEPNASRPDRSILIDVIFKLPCSVAEKEWVSYFYNTDEHLRKRLIQIQQGELSPKDFAADLHLAIDEYLLSYLQNSFREIRSPVSLVGIADRDVFVRNFDKYRDQCMRFFLAFQKNKQREGAEIVRKFKMKLSNEVREERERRIRLKRSGREIFTGEKLIENFGQLVGILFTYGIDIQKFKQNLSLVEEQEGKENWLNRQIERILNEKNLMQQKDFIDTFITEYRGKYVIL